MTMPTPAASPPDDTTEAGAISAGEARFERVRRASGVVLAPAAFGLTYWLVGTSLEPKGRLLAAVLALVATLWVTETLALPVTAVLGACLCVLLGIGTAKEVFAPFADPIVFLFLGSFILARAMTLHGLDRRLALGFLSLPLVGARPTRVLAATGLAAGVLSMWVSNTATAAMMAPIALGVLQTLAPPGRDLRTWPFATGMMLMVAYGASVGGIGTPVGSPPNLIAISQIGENAGRDIAFFEWMSLNVPILAVMGCALLALTRMLCPAGAADNPDPAAMDEYLRRQRAALGPWTAGQRNTLVAFAVAVTLWILPGVLTLMEPDRPETEAASADSSDERPLLQSTSELLNERLPESVVALVAAGLLFVLPVDLRRGEFTMRWEDAVRIDWGTLLLFGGGLSLGTLMFRTGVAAALGTGIVEATGANSVWAMTAAAIAMGIVLSEVSSNTASANMVVPVAIALAQGAGVSSLPPALGACLGASFGFMLPVSTPPNAIAYGTGLVPLTRMIRAGLLFDLIGFVIILGGLRVLCPWLGLM